LNRKAVQFIAYCLVIGLIASFILGTAACSSKTAATTAAKTIVSIAITPNPPPNVTIHTNLQFTATATYTDGTTADISNVANFMGFNDTILKISTTGLAYGVSAGSVKINATWEGVTSLPVLVTVVTP
jgi:trimeric autotransporter adhesin